MTLTRRFYLRLAVAVLAVACAFGFDDSGVHWLWQRVPAVGSLLFLLSIGLGLVGLMRTHRSG